MSDNISQMPCEPPQLELFEHISLLQNQIDQLYILYCTEVELRRATNTVNISLASKVDYMQIQLLEAETEVKQLTAENKRLNLTLNHLVSRHRAFVDRVSTSCRFPHGWAPHRTHTRVEGMWAWKRVRTGEGRCKSGAWRQWEALSMRRRIMTRSSKKSEGAGRSLGA
jgi:hypothetical protein